MTRTIPIIRLYDTLIVSIQIALSDELVRELKDDLAHEIRAQDVSGLVIEVSGVDILDSYIARSIRDIAHIAGLLGVRTVLAGLDPGMAITLVEMGMVMQGVTTALNLEDAIETLCGRGLSRSSKADEWAEIDLDGRSADGRDGAP
jgi:rsbT antagonist protein RsbS